MFALASVLERPLSARRLMVPVFSVDLAAGVAELVDALDLGSSDENRGGSNPSARTSL
jgi:hypothetical protein